MKIYDKARWQIEGGVDEEAVIEHFKFMFTWLDEFNLLTECGKETKEGIVDEDVVLTEEMVNYSGQMFLDKYYDEYISAIQYGVKEDAELLEKMYFSL